MEIKTGLKPSGDDLNTSLMVSRNGSVWWFVWWKTGSYTFITALTDRDTAMRPTV